MNIILTPWDFAYWTKALVAFAISLVSVEIRLALLLGSLLKRNQSKWLLGGAASEPILLLGEKRTLPLSPRTGLAVHVGARPQDSRDLGEYLAAMMKAQPAF